MARFAECSPRGDFVEVGVYRGGSASVLYEISQIQHRLLYLYDTFEGIPFSGPDDTHQVGDFSDCDGAEAIHCAMPEAIVQKGVFPRDQTIPKQIAFAHLDCDQYQSYRESLDIIIPRMVRWGIIMCDDYALAGAAKAIDETPGHKEFTRYGRLIFRF
jgi:hypothetical protein